MTTILKRINDRYKGNVSFKLYSQGDRTKGTLSAQPQQKANLLPIAGRYSFLFSQKAIERHGRNKDKLLRVLLEYFRGVKPDFQVFGIPVDEVL